MITPPFLAFLLQAFGIGVMLLVGAPLMARLILIGGLRATAYAFTTIFLGVLLLGFSIPFHPTVAAILVYSTVTKSFWAAVAPHLGPYIIGRVGLAMIAAGIFALVGILARALGWSPRRV